MSNMQTTVSIFVAAMFPTVVALVGIILNRNDLRDVVTQLSDLRERVARLEAKAS